MGSAHCDDAAEPTDDPTARPSACLSQPDRVLDSIVRDDVGDSADCFTDWHGQCIGPSTAYTDADSKAAQRAESLFEQGHSYRAMQALKSTAVLADLDDPEERARLRALHPASTRDMPLCPSDAPELIVDYDWMEAEMRASDTGATPGPSGYGSNYISVLAADPHCVEALAFIIQQIVNNKLPDIVRTLLTTCTLVSLEKPASDGRRPLAMGDLFCRMASHYVLALVSADAQAAMAPHQYGAGQPDGCTQVVQTVQHLLTCPGPRRSLAVADTSRPLACLSVDVTNAFNTIDRAEILHTVYSNALLARCWRMVAFGYGKPSLLLMRCDGLVPDCEAFIESQTGVRQGDPLAAMLFGLTMHTVLLLLVWGRHARWCPRWRYGATRSVAPVATAPAEAAST